MKTCSCGRSHSLASWRDLPYVGIQRVDGEPDLELRNCACGSTLAIELVDETADTMPAPAFTAAA